MNFFRRRAEEGHASAGIGAGIERVIGDNRLFVLKLPARARVYDQSGGMTVGYEDEIPVGTNFKLDGKVQVPVGNKSEVEWVTAYVIKNCPTKPRLNGKRISFYIDQDLMLIADRVGGASNTEQFELVEDGLEPIKKTFFGSRKKDVPRKKDLLRVLMAEAGMIMPEGVGFVSFPIDRLITFLNQKENISLAEKMVTIGEEKMTLLAAARKFKELS